MKRIDQIRFPKWLRLTLAAAVAFGASFGFMVYAANGVAAGAIFGLPGREHDIAVAQHRGTVGILSGVLLQLGVARALCSYMDRERDRVNHYHLGCGYLSRGDWGMRDRNSVFYEDRALIQALEGCCGWITAYSDL